MGGFGGETWTWPLTSPGHVGLARMVPWRTLGVARVRNFVRAVLDSAAPTADSQHCNTWRPTTKCYWTCILANTSKGPLWEYFLCDAQGNEIYYTDRLDNEEFTTVKKFGLSDYQVIHR